MTGPRKIVLAIMVIGLWLNPFLDAVSIAGAADSVPAAGIAQASMPHCHTHTHLQTAAAHPVPLVPKAHSCCKFPGCDCVNAAAIALNFPPASSPFIGAFTDRRMQAGPLSLSITRFFRPPIA